MGICQLSPGPLPRFACGPGNEASCQICFKEAHLVESDIFATSNQLHFDSINLGYQIGPSDNIGPGVVIGPSVSGVVMEGGKI